VSALSKKSVPLRPKTVPAAKDFRHLQNNAKIVGNVEAAASRREGQG
jgi:hypothetical protein